MGNLFGWVFLIAMIGNLVVFTRLILESIFSKNKPRFYAYKLIESLKKEVAEEGKVHFNFHDAEVLVYTQEWVEKQRGSTND